MVRIVKTEFYKLKRYHILWAGVALMLLSVLLTLFTSMANDGSVWILPILQNRSSKQYVHDFSDVYQPNCWIYDFS